ncbi:MAG: hypothetical protein ACI4U3_05115 [Traorella sp.]
MVEDIIKAVNGQYVYVSRNSFDVMSLVCKEKLLACAMRNHGQFEAFFDCSVNEDELLDLLKICESANTIMLGFMTEKKVHPIEIYHQPIFPGESLVFTKDIMLLQDIPSDCFIECFGNMIVLGRVKGCIHLIYQDCILLASSLNHARIQIFDSDFQNLTHFACTHLYYEKGQIMKEENTWEAVLGSLQEKVE